MDRFRFPNGIPFHKEYSRQPVGTYPGIPVVDLPRGKTHPPEIVSLEIWLKDASLDLVFDTLAEEW